MKKILSCFIITIFSLFGVLPQTGFADQAADGPSFQYMYVFGPDAPKTKGAEDNEQTVFIDVPASASGDVTIKVYDPDTVRKPDAKTRFKWNTSTTFELHGSKLIEKVEFGSGDSTYHKQYFTFGPIKKSKGQKVGNNHRFKLVAKTTAGDDGNLFNVEVMPAKAETFSKNLTFRLVSGRGKKMYFYPEIGEGTTNIMVDNYDLDPSGGTSVIYDPHSKQTYNIGDSRSGEWQATKIKLKSGPARRLVYIITKGYQINGNAGLKVKDGKGNLVPIYFEGPRPVMVKPRPKPAPAPMPEKKPVVNACNQFTFDARSSYDPNNDKITYDWNFGDGNSSTAPVVTHVYDKAGTYKVVLTVSDNSGLECQTSVTTQKVDVNTPPMAAFSGVDKTCVGNKINFDASASKDDKPANLTYYWNFGDGSSAEGKSVSHSYAEGGVYKVTLTVDDNAGSSCSVDSITQMVSVNAPPVAVAGEDQTIHLSNSDAEYNVTFDGGRSSDPNGDNLSYMWKFGDGSSAEGRRVSHTYKKGGNYNAKLVVNDNTGSSCSTDSDSVKVRLNKAPVANAGTAQSTCQGKELTFDGSASYGETGEKLSYSWDFGDGTTGTGKTVTHKYKQGGDYNVTLTVDDGKGTSVSTDVDAVSVSINSKPRVKLQKVGMSCVDDKVYFDASDSGDADGDRLRYTWDFGDGTVVEAGSKTSHRYAKGGKYKVRVTVDDGQDSSCSTTSRTTNVVVNAPPVANTGPNLVCCQNEQTSFDGSASSDPDGNTLTYSWDFGDGQGSDKATVSHAYAESGTYNIVLTVDDGTGTQCSSSSSGFTADVNAKPVPVIKITQR